jgi:hypothetical protein
MFRTRILGTWQRFRMERSVSISSTVYYPQIYPKPSIEEEKAYLEDMVKGLEEEIKTIQKRLQELSKEKRRLQSKIQRSS